MLLSTKTIKDGRYGVRYLGETFYLSEDELKLEIDKGAVRYKVNGPLVKSIDDVIARSTTL